MTGAESPVAGLIQHDRVHRRLYTDPELFELEQTRVFAASWCFVAHESQLPQPHDFLTTTVGNRPVVVTRGEDGEVRAMVNRCRHRGAVVVEGNGCARRFTCPYHGWTYGDDGRLVGLPYPRNHRSADRRELGLGQLAVGSFRGFVFATLHPDPQPVEAWLGPATEAFDVLVDRHPGGRIRFAPTAQRVEFRGNWKLSWDNAADGIHATFAHHAYNQLGQATDVDTVLDAIRTHRR